MVTSDRSVGLWVKRIGVGGAVFFLIKGLAWLFIPILLAKVAAGR